MFFPPGMVFFSCCCDWWRRFFPPHGKNYTVIRRIYLDLYQVFVERTVLFAEELTSRPTLFLVEEGSAWMESASGGPAGEGSESYSDEGKAPAKDRVEADHGKLFGG
jgi:hypothetical protein